MKKITILFLSILCLLLSSETLMAFEKDSVGLETVNGKVFILHKVEAKETLYSLSRRYDVGIEEIRKYNSDLDQGLKIDHIIKIPYNKANQSSGTAGTHTVAPSQTLFSISKLYGVSVDDIKKWNKMSSNDLSVGQTIFVQNPGRGQSASAGTEREKANQTRSERETPGNKRGGAEDGKLVHKVEPGQTLFAISKMYEVSVEEIKRWNSLEGNSLEVGQQLSIQLKSKPDPYTHEPEKPIVKQEEREQEKVVRLDTNKTTEPKEEEKSSEEKSEKKPASRKENSSGFKKVVELGMAEVIEDATDTKKYVALHRTAPIGTIMQVTNEMNSQNVFVRVIGKLPATGANDKVLIKLSKPAFERLGAVNNRFPAEISYVP